MSSVDVIVPCYRYGHFLRDCVERVMGSFPVAEKSASEFVSLPMFAELTGEQIARVATELKAVVTVPVN